MLENFHFKAVVLLALPGSGKTTLVKSLRREHGDGVAVDLDYRGSKKVSDKVRALHTQLINARIEEGCKVITTFDNWINPEGLNPGVLCVYCLPKDVSVLTDRTRVRDGSSTFPVEYSRNANAWLDKWILHAKLHSNFDPKVVTSLTITAYIDYSKYYLDSWFVDFLHLVDDFLGIKLPPCGDDSLAPTINKVEEASKGLYHYCGLQASDISRLHEWYWNDFVNDIIKSYSVSRSDCEIDDIPGGGDYCGSSEC